MSAQREPEFTDPVELLDELDAVLAEQEQLRRRMLAVQARYQALQGPADAGRFDNQGEDGWVLADGHGAVNVEFAAKYVGDCARFAQDVIRYGLHARDLAARVREYPQPQREQPERPVPGSEQVRPVIDRGRSR